MTDMALPSIGEPVHLRDAAGMTYASRVEDIEADVITIARPTDLRAAIEYAEGVEFNIVWAHSSGIHIVPVVLAATSTERHLRLWHLQIVGQPEVQQRRDYVRLPVDAAVTLCPDGKSQRGSSSDPRGRSAAQQHGIKPTELRSELTGRLIDISEVALQCSVARPPDGKEVAVGSEVRSHFKLNDATFDTAGVVAIVRPDPDPHHIRLVVLVEETRAVAEALRKEIFALQLIMRRQRS